MPSLQFLVFKVNFFSIQRLILRVQFCILSFKGPHCAELRRHDAVHVDIDLVGAEGVRGGAREGAGGEVGEAGGARAVKDGVSVQDWISSCK